MLRAGQHEAAGGMEQGSIVPPDAAAAGYVNTGGLTCKLHACILFLNSFLDSDLPVLTTA